MEVSVTDSEININPDSRQIILSRGKVAIVDIEDFERLNQYKWHCTTLGYATRQVRIGKGTRKRGLRKTLFMHREIVKCPFGMETDHINGEKLDNRRCNLRICTRSQNQINNKKYENCSSKYKGVSWVKRTNKWSSRIQYNSKCVNLGYFNSEIDAALTYNTKALELFGVFAKLNIIED